jgi:multisubunit Na+/H+ antiporter MnhC subunit
VVAFVQAAIVLMAIVIGLGIFVFGLSELRSGAEELPIVEGPPAAEEPGETNTGESS